MEFGKKVFFAFRGYKKMSVLLCIYRCSYMKQAEKVLKSEMIGYFNFLFIFIF